jgi:HK97 family phage portal protein
MRPWLESLRSFVLGPFNLKDANPQLKRLFGSSTASSGETVNEWTALNISAVWAAVTLIAGSVGALPLILYRRTGTDGKERYDEHYLYELLHDQPNPEMTAMVFRETLQGHALTWGNGYAEIERDQSGRAMALWPITPDRVTPYRESNGALRYRIGANYYAESPVPAAELDAADVLHIPGLGYDGLCGYSVISKARNALGLTMATESFGSQFFGNGTRPGGVLQHKGRLSPDAHERLRTDFEAHYSGPNRHRPAVLEEGMTWQQIGIPPDDAQFLNTRQFQVVEVARWFNVPPHKLRDLSRATYSNIESQAIEFVVDTLTPWLVRWEQECNRKLIRPLERHQQFVKHSVNALLRGDIASRFSAYAVGRQWGWLSANDIRRLEDENPIGAKGDVYLEPSNMMPATPTPRPEATPSPPPPAAPPADEAPPRSLLLIVQERLDSILEEYAHKVAEIPALPAPPDILEPIGQRLAALTEAVAALHREEPPAAEAEPEPPPREEHVQADTVGAARAQLIASQRAVVEEVVGRMIRRETSRIRPSAPRDGQPRTPEKLREWIPGFYAKHGEIYREAIRPVLQAHLALMGGEEDPQTLAERFVAAALEESRKELHEVADGEAEHFVDALELLCVRWERVRPAAAADQLMLSELATVSTARSASMVQITAPIAPRRRVLKTVIRGEDGRITAVLEEDQ